MAELELRQVSKSFDGRQRIVDSVSFQLLDGETLTILGPSGCGKSTLLRLVSGLEKPDQGEILLDGTRVNDAEPKDRDVAMVFQSYALYPHMRVRENIAVSLRIRRIPASRIDQLVTETARRLGIDGYLDRYPRQLSGGERQRVALARALVRQPKLFLLDEPLSNLDAQLREHARAQLRQIFQEFGASVLYVTHDQIEALTLSDRVAVMREGRVVQIGTPADIYAHPATVFVASFVGSPQMNLIEGERIGQDAATVGYRPEEVTIDPDGPLEMRISLREPLGSQHLLILQRDDLRLTAMIPAEVRTAETVRIRLDPRRAHRFDRLGKRID